MTMASFKVISDALEMVTGVTDRFVASYETREQIRS